MTYRRLFLYLLIGSTLALAGVWWQSVRSCSTFVFNLWPGGPFVSGTLYSANLELGLIPDHAPSSTFSFKSITDPGLLSYLEDASRHMGNFHLSKERNEASPFGASYEVYQLRLPLWFPWLLFVAGGYAFVRVMERRSATGKEKVLAARDAAEKLS